MMRAPVDLLLRVGRAGDLSAAAAIERALAIDGKLIALTPAERVATLGVLDDPPDGLAELRGLLMRHRDRDGR